MNVQTFIACLIIIAGAAVYFRFFRQEKKTGDEYDTADLLPAIQQLARLAESLENADTMIADLRACNPRELLRGFRTNWIGLDGKRRMIDFLANGRNNATSGLLTAAQDQRETINAQIIEIVRAMNAALTDGGAPAICLDVVGESVDETTETAEAGEW